MAKCPPSSTTASAPGIVRASHSPCPVGTSVSCGPYQTATGTVTAASDWGGGAERKRVRPALLGSWERLFHETNLRELVLLTGANREVRRALSEERLERAIGVIYLPETERVSHYFEARLAQQFDAMIHVDETRAVEPLERTSQWEAGELPETYPSAV